MKNIEITLKALADKNRLRIIGLLSHKDFCVCELAHVLGITQPSVSKHLKKLKVSGIIDSRQDGFWTIYFLSASKDKGCKKVIDTTIKILSKNSQIQKDITKAENTSREKLCSK